MIDDIVRHPALPFKADSLCLRAASRACTNESAMKLIVIGIALGDTALTKTSLELHILQPGKTSSGRMVINTLNQKGVKARGQPPRQHARAQLTRSHHRRDHTPPLPFHVALVVELHNGPS